MKYRILLLVSVFTVFLSCKKDNTENPDLTGYTWTLTEVYGQTLPDSVVATLFLSPDASVSNGSGGCNVYGADYTLSGASLQFDNLISTEKACLGKMSWESDFFKALLECQSYQIENGKLELRLGTETIAVLE